jgi:uncharacterized membrane protein YkvA (DUF1232 family)
MLAGIKLWARGVKRDVIALWLAARDPATSLIARVLAMIVAAYALSPIDLIPDFIPILGYLDDLVLVPVGIWLVIQLVPSAQMALHRVRAQSLADRPTSRIAAIVIIGIWICSAAAAVWLSGLRLT